MQHEASGEHRRESKLEENEPCNPTMQPDFLSKLDRAEERDARAAHQRVGERKNILLNVNNKNSAANAEEVGDKSSSGKKAISGLGEAVGDGEAGPKNRFSAMSSAQGLSLGGGRGKEPEREAEAERDEVVARPALSAAALQGSASGSFKVSGARTDVVQARKRTNLSNTSFKQRFLSSRRPKPDDQSSPSHSFSQSAPPLRKDRAQALLSRRSQSATPRRSDEREGSGAHSFPKVSRRRRSPENRKQSHSFNTSYKGKHDKRSSSRSPTNGDGVPSQPWQSPTAVLSRLDAQDALEAFLTLDDQQARMALEDVDAWASPRPGGFPELMSSFPRASPRPDDEDRKRVSSMGRAFNWGWPRFGSLMGYPLRIWFIRVKAKAETRYETRGIRFTGRRRLRISLG